MLIIMNITRFTKTDEVLVNTAGQLLSRTLMFLRLLIASNRNDNDDANDDNNRDCHDDHDHDRDDHDDDHDHEPFLTIAHCIN